MQFLGLPDMKRKEKKKTFTEAEYLVFMRIKILAITIIPYSLSLLICINYLQRFFNLKLCEGEKNHFLKISKFILYRRTASIQVTLLVHIQQTTEDTRWVHILLSHFPHTTKLVVTIKQ